MKLIIGNKNYSSWSLRPWLLLSMYDIPFEEIRVPLFTESTQETLSRYTNAGKVPVLHDGDIVVWDSLAICEYISEQYLAGKGWPVEVAVRAQARSCCAEMHSGFSHLRQKMPMNCRASGRKVEITPELEADIKRIIRLWSDLRGKYSDKGSWLFGEFSIADCMFAPVVTRFRTYDVTVPEICSAYMESVLANEKMQLWYQQAAEESEIIKAGEAGV